MNEQKEKFVKSVKEAKHILVIADPNKQDAHLAAAGLTLGLDKLGKRALLTEALALPIWQEQDWSLIDADIGNIKDLVITIKNQENQVSEIRYEKTGEPVPAVKIFVRPSQQQIGPQDVVVASAEPNFDLIMLAGIKNAEQLNRFKEKYFPIFVKSQVIALNAQAPDQEIASAYYLAQDSNCLSQVVYKLINEINLPGKKLDPKIADILLASLVSGTANFQNECTTSAVLKLAAELIEQGADIRRAGELTSREISLQPGASLEKALPELKEPWQGLLKRARMNEKKNLRWLALEEQEAAGLLPEEDFIELTRQLAVMEPTVPHNLLLATLATGNPHPVIKGWLKSPHRTVLNELADLLSGFVFNDVLTFPVRAQSLEEAERKMLKLAESVFDR